MSTILQLLHHNPTIDNSDLAGVIRANRGVDFKGYIHVSDKLYKENNTQKSAKVLYFTSYGSLRDLFASIIRFLVGVSFGPIGGSLESNLAQGRRVTIILPLDGSEEKIITELDQPGLITRAYRSVFN